ncbi:transcriptional regulator [Aurantiacibacter gangjinensis]|uniref:MarR family transcriptional regulator n=1 Tax=Aurantiacibacter gangjinensis TaxID=502682 RepID=A0A0G9MRG9_9SPHN|nr:transcriptional regulator [Aurantiacibacter gangjinensis]APE27969.1 Transcriptional regulator [Aurantiacibacter gangjinensis]KLE31913.1 MarR family transcriptional regulator [Aurantiacibacter gangjinensis]
MSGAAEIDPVLHHPARLQISAVLSNTDDVEFARLRELVDVSDSVLSKHLSAMAEAGYVKLEKAARDGRQRTWARFTGEGKRAFAAHMRALQELVASAQEGLAAG